MPSAGPKPALADPLVPGPAQVSSQRAAEAALKASGFEVLIPFIAHLGIRLVRNERGRSEVQMRVLPHMENSLAVAHGGVVMSILDVAMAMAARSVRTASEEDFGQVTIEMKTTFLQPARGLITCVGQCVHRTATMAFCEAELRSETGALLARSSGTFKFVKQRKLGRP